MFVSPPNSHIGTRTPAGDGVRRGALRSALTPRRRSPTHGASALITGAPQSALAPPATESTVRRASRELGSGPAAERDRAGDLALDFQPLEP